MNGKWNVVLTLLTGSVQGPHEKRLLHHLLDKYNTLERPVANESEPIQVSFGITLMQIIDVVSWTALPCFNEIIFNFLRNEMAMLRTFRASSKGCVANIQICRSQIRTAEPCRRLPIFWARTLNSFNAIGSPLARNAPALDLIYFNASVSTRQSI